MTARGDGSAARSVDDDDDARWVTQRRHSSFGSPVDVNSRFLRWLLLVIGAGPVEPSIAQHNAAFGAQAVAELERSVGAEGGVVLRYGRFYGPGTYHEQQPPEEPRIHIDRAAERTVTALGEPKGIVVITD